MRIWLTTALALAVLATLAWAQEEGAAPVRFEAVDVYVDAGDQPLAAYQFELQAAPPGAAVVVGVEGGEHAAFADPPYYDPAALKGGRIIIAAFDTGRDLPTGRTRVARLHMQVSGPEEADYTIQLQVAGSPDGERIEADASLAKGE